MFLTKKRVIRQEVKNNEDERIDFWRIIAQSLHMGLSKVDTGQMRIGEYMDVYDAYKEIHNMEMKKMLYVIPDRLDKPVSMRDL